MSSEATLAREMIAEAGAETLEDAVKQSDIEIAEPEVTVKIQVQCRDCGRVNSMQSLLNHGSCECF